MGHKRGVPADETCGSSEPQTHISVGHWIHPAHRGCAHNPRRLAAYATFWLGIICGSMRREP